MSDISNQIDQEIAAAGNPPVSAAQIAATALAAHQYIYPPHVRYVVLSVPNAFAGERYTIVDTLSGYAIIAEFYNIVHREGSHLVIDQAIGWAHAQMFAQIVNVQDEASK